MYPKVDVVPVLTDNYSYLVHSRDGHGLAVVDPGEAKPIEEFIAANRLMPTEIWLTHRHHDHIAGMTQLAQRYGIPVKAPAEIRVSNTRGVQVEDGDHFPFGPSTVRVAHVGGHTVGHVVYFVDDIVLTGDVLFVGGCGRVFEGTPEDMFRGLDKHFYSLPDNVRIYCGHEYALKNLMFALELEPENTFLRSQYSFVRGLVAESRPTVPGEIGREKKTNPFLRVDDPDFVRALRARGVSGLDSRENVFAAVRRLRDKF